MENTFINSISEQEARTLNQMKARKNTADPCTDLFFKIGASRGKDIRPEFYAAYEDDHNIALRILLWARDARQGAGERELFRQVLRELEKTHTQEVLRVIPKVPNLGRWDDLLVFNNPKCQATAFELIRAALEKGNGLCAKWMPRKGKVAAKLRSFLGWSQKYYRKRLVELTKVVETQMCANRWNEIDFEKVPSLAAARYKSAFNRHAVETFKEYVEKVKRGEAKVNAGAVYPYDVLKGVANYTWKMNFGETELDHIREQWKALPNYMKDAKILPMIDVSASMNRPAAGSSNAMDVAVSLGLYMADKNPGAFKDAFLTFSGRPELQIAKGDIISKVKQVVKAHWDVNTNLHAAFEVVLETAKRNYVKAEDMPEIIVIFSDMQFDTCVRFDDSAIEMIRRKYEQAGYNIPRIVFWNIVAYSNVPVRFNEKGVALVSGFSPAIMKAVLEADLEQFTPRNIMLKTVMVPRYDI